MPPTESPRAHICFSTEPQDLELDTEPFRRLAESICSRFDVENASVDIAIVDDETMVQINRQFLGRETKTDVISFDLSDEAASCMNWELVVNWDRACRESARRGHSSQAELALYITHGLLHQLGYDDQTQAEAERMHQMEDEILQSQGFGIVYQTDEN